jgi:hypothetical protein
MASLRERARCKFKQRSDDAVRERVARRLVGKFQDRHVGGLPALIAPDGALAGDLRFCGQAGPSLPVLLVNPEIVNQQMEFDDADIAEPIKRVRFQRLEGFDLDREFAGHGDVSKH